MSSRSMSKYGWLAVCCALLFLPAGFDAARSGEDAIEVGVYEKTVTVRSEVTCRKYEGRVLYCTVNPLHAVRDAVDVKLVLGYASISIGGDAYRVEPQTGGEVKFQPRGEGFRKDYSGEQEIEITVIYVN